MLIPIRDATNRNSPGYRMTRSFERTLCGVSLLTVCVLRPVNRYGHHNELVGCLLAYLTPQQHVSVSQGRICLDKFTCCHTEIEVADQTLYLTPSQYTDTEPTSSALTEAPGRLATGLPFFQSRLDSTWRKRESNPSLMLSRRTP